jgi:hypothetical protein
MNQSVYNKIIKDLSDVLSNCRRGLSDVEDNVLDEMDNSEYYRNNFESQLDLDEISNLNVQYLKAVLSEAYTKIIASLEVFNLDTTRTNVKKNVNKMKKDGEFDWTFFPEHRCLDCEVLDYLENIFDVLACYSDEYHIEQDNLKTEGYDYLKKFCERSGTYVMDFYKKSEKSIEGEQEVQDAMDVYLKTHFAGDFHKNITISGSVKGYKPDGGIKSLSTALEYKYVATETKARNVVGEIFDDSLGYGNSKDWTRFIAVLYLEKPYFSQQHYEKEFRERGLKGWEVIVQIVPSEEKKKKTKKNEKSS